MLEALVNTAMAEERCIRATLTRIEEDVYGTCLSCGEKQLGAAWNDARCINCASL